MKQVVLGNSGLSVSEMCFGAMNLGTSVDKRTSFTLLDAFIDEGGTFIDTSNNYAHWYPGATGDESETLLGEWFARSGKRSKVILATKVGFDRHGTGQGLKAHQIEQWCDESLRKFKTDVIDLYYAHVDDMDTPVEETMGAFNRLIKKGKVRAIGGSNYYTWRLEEIRQTCKNSGLQSYSVLQQRYSYLYQKNALKTPHPFNESASSEKLCYLAKHNMPLVAYSCLARGGYSDNNRIPSEYIKGERLDVLNDIALEMNIPASSLVLAWMMHSWRFNDRPQIIPLFSSSNLEHLMQNIKASEIVLSNEHADKLNCA